MSEKKNVSTRTHDVIIVGGGVIGLLSTLEFSRQGLSVLLIDKQTPGREASWAGGGIISSLYPWSCSDKMNALINWSHCAYPSLVEELFSKTGIDPELVNTGLLYIEESEASHGLSWCAQHNPMYESLSVNRVQQIEPNLVKPRGQSLLLPAIHSVRNPRLLSALTSYLSNLKNVTLLSEAAVFEVLVRNDVAVGVRTELGDFKAKTVVVTAGAWSKLILKQFKLTIPMVPVLGQMISIQAAAGFLKRTVLYKDRYVIPRKDGLILIGSTLENTGFEKRTSEAGLSSLRSVAEYLLPGLKHQPTFSHWAGLRPRLGNGPWIGGVPGCKNLYVNSGHFRNGLASAPASARLISDIVTNEVFDSFRVSILPEADYAPICLVDISEKA